VWNRGTDATAVTATAYWSPPAALVTPALWNLIGSASFADVPPGQVVQVSDPGITWPQADIPAPGHYCFVATVGNADDPAPDPAAFASFADFVAYIYAHNNISWRNFNVVANVPHRIGELPGEFVRLPFLISGAWDSAQNFAFETLADLPGGGRMVLEVPDWLGQRLRPAPDVLEEHRAAVGADPDDRRVLRIRVDPNGRRALGEVELPAGATAESHLLVHVPVGQRDRRYEVAVRQMYEGREVGRLTWRLVPASRPGSRS